MNADQWDKVVGIVCLIITILYMWTLYNGGL